MDGRLRFGMLQLRVVPARGEPFEHAVEGDSVVIGRSSQCDLTIADPFLSRRHARLTRRSGGWVIEDLGSHNGTLLHGRRITTDTPVADGDEIQLSGSLIEVRGEPSDGSGTTLDFGLPEHTVLRPASDILDSQRRLTAEERTSVEALRRHSDRLRLLNEVHHALAGFIELPALLELILDRAFEHLGPEEGVILLAGPDAEYDLAAHRTREQGGGPYRISRTLIHEVVERGQAALVLDVAADERFAEAESILASGVRSLIAAPLQDEDGALGMIALTARLEQRRFAEEDLELLTSLASVAGLRIRNLALSEEAAEHRRLEAELRLARQIQIALLPEVLPQPAGYALHGTTVPSRRVSGDIYEAIERADGSQCVLVVADVSGKGIAASLLTASLEALLIGPIELGRPPEEICERVGRRLYGRTPAAKYATAFVAALEPASGRLLYANAGHNPALLLRAAGAVQLLEPTGTPLGLLPESAYRCEEVSLDAGDTLVIYTDGLTEAVNREEEEFGIDRLVAACKELRGAPLEELGRALESDLDAFVAGVPYADDRTLLMVRRL